MYECAQSAITFNNLNLSNYDLNQTQARDQVLMNFHRLNESFIQITNKHIQKGRMQKEKIQSIKKRIIQCQERLKSLQGMDQALVFVSPALYPRKYQFDPVNNLSSFKEYLQRTKLYKIDMNAQYSVKHQVSRLGAKSKVTLNTLDSFVMFMLGQLCNKSTKPQIKTGIGSIPKTVTCVDSLLVFNTNINPYWNYQITEVKYVQKVQKTKEAETVEMPNVGELKNFVKLDYQQKNLMPKPAAKTPIFDMFQEDLPLSGIVGLQVTQTAPLNIKQGMVKKVQAADPYALKSKKSMKQSTTTMQQKSSDILQPLPQLQRNTSAPPISNLPVPLPLPTLTLPSTQILNLLPPPTLTLPLPPAPKLTLPLPSLGPALKLPPPTFSLPPLLNLPPPTLSTGLPVVTGDRANMLQELRSGAARSKLKKTVTIEKGGLIKPSDIVEQAPSQFKPAGPPGAPLSFLDSLKAKVFTRYNLLHQGDDD